MIGPDIFAGCDYNHIYNESDRKFVLLEIEYQENRLKKLEERRSSKEMKEIYPHYDDYLNFLISQVDSRLYSLYKISHIFGIRTNRIII